MAVVNSEIRFAPQLTAWFTANATKVLQDGEIVYCSDGVNQGKYVIGNNVAQLSTLPFYGGVSSTYTASDGVTLTGSNFTLNNSYFTGEASLAAGNVTLSNSAVIGKVLTGYTSGAGVVAATDTILQAIQKLNGNIGAINVGLTVGTTTITSGTNTRVLYNNNGVVGEYAVTGTGTTAVLSTSPTFTTDITTPLVYGGTGSGGTLTLQSTTNATKGKILFGTSGYDEVNNRLGIGTQSPTEGLHLSGKNILVRGSSGTVLDVGNTFSVFNVVASTGVCSAYNLFVTNGSMTIQTTTPTLVFNNSTVQIRRSTNSLVLDSYDDLIFRNTLTSVETGRVTSTASWVLGNAAIATNATDGFLYITSCAGTPTGVPTTKTGRIPIVADSTNNKLYIYSGGAWVALN
jgi:hypothetical protein